jgi:hypothetical protein
MDVQLIQLVQYIGRKRAGLERRPSNGRRAVKRINEFLTPGALVFIIMEIASGPN